VRLSSRGDYEREAVASQHDQAASGRSVASHQVERAAGDTQVPDHALALQLEQGLHRAARAGGGVERDALGVVEMHELEPVEAEKAQAPLDRAPDLAAAEVAGLRIGVGLRRQHET